MRPISFIIDEETGCWNCTSHKPNEDGYPNLYRNHQSRSMHHQLYEAIYGVLVKGTVIRHICDNPICINPKHLLAGTHADNCRDRAKKGRSAIGSKHGRSKLTEIQAKEIKDSTMNNMALGRKYGVDKKVIYKIKNDLNWIHV